MTCRHRDNAHTDSHMHTQGHPGRLKDRSYWTHPHGDKESGRLLLHQGAQRGGTHPREIDPFTYPRTGSYRDAVTHRGKEESLSPTQKKSVSHACMNTEHLHTAAHYKRPCHSEARMCSHEPSHTGISACRDSCCHSVKCKHSYTSTHVYTT